jgi:Fe-S cluster assembly protein SufD
MKHAAIREDLLADAVSRLPDNGLRSMRSAALRKFLKTGLPGTTHEDWRYTSLQPAIEIGNAWLGRVSNSPDVPLDAIEDFATQKSEQGIDASWLRFRNGRITGRTELEVRDPAVEISTLSSVNGSSVSDTSLQMDDALSSFNAALLVDAVRVRVAEDATVGKPLGLLLANDASDNATMSACRILIDVGRNACIDIVESHISVTNSASYSNIVIELNLAPNARVNFLRLQENSDAAISTSYIIARIGESAMLTYSGLDIGGSLIRNNLTALIESKGAEFSAAGIYLATGTQHIDNHVRVDHKIGPARSQAEFRGILQGRSRCVFNSKAIVHKGADGTDAQQSNHNLLLSAHAEIDTKPELEIYADDVKCAHGATVGQLDKTALFYLRSRGIDKDAATGMLTRAFAASIVSKLSVAAAADYVSDLVNRRLDEMVEI